MLWKICRYFATYMLQYMFVFFFSKKEKITFAFLDIVGTFFVAIMAIVVFLSAWFVSASSGDEYDVHGDNDHDEVRTGRK